MSNCLFCRIAKKELPAKIVYEDNHILCFEDINPQAPVHLLMIPKGHVEGISALKEQDIAMAGQLLYRARKIAESKKLSDYRVVFNNGPGAGQSVFHLHMHLLGGRPMAWPPG